MTDKERIEIRKLRTQGIMPTEISKITGIKLETIKSYFKRHKNMMPKSIKCLNCGKTLTTTKGKKNKKFCCDKCRNQYWNSHLDQVNKQAYYKLVCEYCGKEFLSYGNKRRKFCSRECYKKSLRKYKSNNLIVYNLSVSILEMLHENGILTDKDYMDASSIVAANHGLNSTSIFVSN